MKKTSENFSKNHLQVLAGDIRNYGANDYVVLTKGSLALEYYQNDGLGNFTLNETVSKRLSDNFTGRPVTGELIDLNTDGRLDLIVASTYNGESKVQIFLIPERNNVLNCQYSFL